MGYDFDRIVSNHIDEGLVCAICSDVLDRPVMVGTCEHVYCKDCIESWLRNHKTCPQDRSNIVAKQLVPIPRFMKNQLHSLKVKCRFAAQGCDLITTIENIDSHEKNCKYNEINTRISKRIDNKSQEFCHLKRIVKRRHHFDYQVIRSSLPNPFKKLMIKLAKEALYLYGRVNFGQIAAYVKTHLEPEENRYWHCVVGTDFDCLLTANLFYITIRIDAIYIIAFKTK